MKKSPFAHHRLPQVIIYALGVAALWTLIIAASLAWNIYYRELQTLARAEIMARLALDKDMTFRSWVTQHGGVYVPVTPATPSNPYLTVPDKDAATGQGKPLTLMNPAYVMRQVYEQFEKKGGVKGHLTSLRPLRPANRPDPWEEQALKAFAGGRKEATVTQTMDGAEYMRFMQPLVTEAGCLKCHAAQGYREGDIRGGISVAVPLAQLRALQRSSVVMMMQVHALFWGLGLAGIFIFGASGLRGERQLQKTKDLLIQSEKLAATGTLAAGVAHEILNPINILSMRLQLLEQLEKLSDTSMDTLSICKLQIDRIVKIINELDQLTQASPSLKAPYDLNGMIRQIPAVLAERLKKESIAIDLDLEDDLPMLTLDKERLDQVFLILINNAIDAMEGRDNKRITITTKPLIDQKGLRSISVSISDRGHGIKEENLKRIFEPFFTTRAPGMGTGIGLAIAYRIIEEQGGTIWAENNEWGGAIFHIELPVVV